MGEILPKTFGKCCLRYDLMIGCAVYVTVEIYLWAMLTLASIYTESKMIENREVGAFKNFSLNSSYYVTAFGETSDDIGHTVIFTQIVINGFLSIGLLLYCIFAVILLIGISERNLPYFAPYLYLDTVFLYLSIVVILFAILIQHKIAFRNALIFALKFYPSSCIYSLYKKLGGNPITFSSYASFVRRNSSLNNPAIRLARSDTDFEVPSSKSSNEFIKPRVSFQSITEDMQPSSLSEPNVSPQIVKEPTQETVLKPCFRKSLQLPVNNSYP